VGSTEPPICDFEVTKRVPHSQEWDYFLEGA
jgi:hypothetical protein